MNIITEALPETVKVDGRVFFINSDYRVMIRFEKRMQDRRLDDAWKVSDTLRDFYKGEIPEDITKAWMEMIRFYLMGGELPTDEKSEKRRGLQQTSVYDWEVDSAYIFGAFYSQYGIDLNETEHMHWWKFLSLFKSLNSDNKIVEIMGYRATDLSKIKDDAERQRIANLQHIYAIPTNYTKEEKASIIGAVFSGGFR